MRKRTILIISLILLFIVVSIFAVLIIPGIDSSNFTDSNGLTADQKKEAIWIAVTDSDIKQILLENPSNCRVTEVSPLGSGGFTGKAGYINTTGMYAQVPISVGGEGLYSVHYIAYVNLSGKEVTGTESASYRHLPAGADVKIPAGASWYHQLDGKEFFRLKYRESNVKIQPLVLDEANLQKALEGKTYKAENQSLNRSPVLCEYNGTLSGESGKYLVVVNEDKSNTTSIDVLVMIGF